MTAPDKAPDTRTPPTDDYPCADHASIAAEDVVASRLATAAEWSVAAVLTAASVALHITAWRHMGALWRDEANAVEMGRMTLAQAWVHLPFDSVLMGPIVVLRAMALAGLSDNDLALRTLGMTFGLLILAALWWASLRLSGRPPLLALVLFGLSPVGVRYGDSLRAYPFATLTLVIAFILVSQAQRDASRRAVALASLASAVAVQCSYLNAVLIGALCAGGLTAVLASRSMGRLSPILAPGIAAAASASVYLGRMRATSAILGVQVRPLSFDYVVRRLGWALATPSRPVGAVWVLSLAVALGISAHRLRERPAQERLRVLFLAPALAGAVTLYLLFLKHAGVEPFPWHFTPLLAFAALALDALTGRGLAAAHGVRAAIAALVALAGLVVFPHADELVRFRQTNIDRVAAILAERAVRGDLVVVSPYHCGVSFQRYYRGAAEWATLPPVEDHRVHRYDMVKSAMLSPDPLAPVLHRADEALRSGHKVFVVVDGPIFRHPPARPVTPAVPDPDWGWYAGMHFQIWALQFGFFLQTHATRTDQIVIPSDEDVSPFERMLLLTVEGHVPGESDG